MATVQIVKGKPDNRAILRRAHYILFKKYQSQIGQDRWVAEDVFDRKRGGYFVEVGAANGVFISNTLALELRYNWTGVCIEPNPESFKQLVRNRAAICLNCGAASAPGILPFNPDDLDGSFTHLDGPRARRIDVPVEKLTDLLLQCCPPDYRLHDCRR